MHQVNSGLTEFAVRWNPGACDAEVVCGRVKTIVNGIRFVEEISQFDVSDQAVLKCVDLLQRLRVVGRNECESLVEDFDVVVSEVDVR